MEEAIIILAKLLQEKREIIKEKDSEIATLTMMCNSFKSKVDGFERNFVSIKALKCCKTMDMVQNLIESVEEGQ